jgi:hypothetical protein
VLPTEGPPVWRADVHGLRSSGNPVYVYDWVNESTLFLYDGNPSGYDSTFRWLLAVDGAPLDVIAIRADADPELELLAPRIDYPHAPQPVIPTTPGNWGLWDRPGSLSPLASLGDLDGDGFDEVLLTGRRNNDAIDLHILSSGSGYDIEQPLVSLGLQSGWKVRSLPVDIDLDGHIDVVAVDEGIFGGNGLIQVWFGPLVDLPEPEPHTGDTGSTGETGSTDTGDRIEPSATTRRPRAGLGSRGGCHGLTYF